MLRRSPEAQEHEDVQHHPNEFRDGETESEGASRSEFGVLPYPLVRPWCFSVVVNSGFLGIPEGLKA